MNSGQVDRRDSRFQLRRCYKMVSLIHVNRQLEFFFVVAARVVSGRRHERPLLYELAEQFVAAAGPGVMRMLIVDRGLIDGPRMGRLSQHHHVDTLVPLRGNMDTYADAVGLTRLPGFQWEPYRRSEDPPPPPVPKPDRIVKREAKRQQTLAQRKAEADALNPAAVRRPALLLSLLCHNNRNQHRCSAPAAQWRPLSRPLQSVAWASNTKTASPSARPAWTPLSFCILSTAQNTLQAQPLIYCLNRKENDEYCSSLCPYAVESF